MCWPAVCHSNKIVELSSLSERKVCFDSLFQRVVVYDRLLGLVAFRPIVRRNTMAEISARWSLPSSWLPRSHSWLSSSWFYLPTVLSHPYSTISQEPSPNMSLAGDLLKIQAGKQATTSHVVPPPRVLSEVTRRECFSLVRALSSVNLTLKKVLFSLMNCFLEPRTSVSLKLGLSFTIETAKSLLWNVWHVHDLHIFLTNFFYYV